jgi:hypothetical protein
VRGGRRRSHHNQPASPLLINKERNTKTDRKRERERGERRRKRKREREREREGRK